jgi:hypothetical protein
LEEGVVPQVGVAIGTAIGTATATVLGGGFAALAVGSFVGTAVYYATNSFLLNKALSLLQKRPKTGESRGLEATFIDSSADARVIYGEVRVGGVNILPSDWVSGDNNDFQHQILAFSIHEIDSFVEFYFDKDTLPAPDAITGTANDGLISTGKFRDAAWVRGYRGTMTQNVDFKLNDAFPAEWPSTSRGRGVAYAALTYKWGKGDRYRGFPNVTALIRGARVYDPRLDSTNGGAGSHRYNDATTWAWSSNPALCWANYRIASYGYGNDPAVDINWSTVATAADVCDVLVDDKDGGTQARYTCNGLLVNSPDSLLSNEMAIIDAMMGHRRKVAGKWEILAGGWVAPLWTIEKSDWVSIESIKTVSGPEDGRINRVHCFYVSPDRNWQRVECDPRSNPIYLSDDAGVDGEVEMEQPLCTDESEAQRKAEFLLRSSRNGILLVGVLPPRFQKIRTFDTVALNFAELQWVSKTFRVVPMTFNVDGSVRVVLVEEQESDWTDLASSEYGAPSLNPLPSINPTAPAAPSSFSVLPLLGTLQFDFGDPVVKPTGTRFQILRSPGSLSVAGSSELLWEGDATRMILPADMRSYFWYHGRAVANSYLSATMPNTFGIGSKPWIAPEAMPGNRAYPDGELFFASNSYWEMHNARASHSYYLVGSGGVRGERGKLVIACESDSWSDGTIGSQVLSTRMHPLRFDVNSRASYFASPIFPGQSGSVMCLFRRATAVTSAAGLFPSISMRVYPVSVNSPKALDLGAPLVTINVSTISQTSGDWNVAVGSFTMPSSTQYDAVTLALRFFDSAQNPGVLEVGGLQLSTL